MNKECVQMLIPPCFLTKSRFLIELGTQRKLFSTLNYGLVVVFVCVPLVNTTFLACLEMPVTNASLYEGIPSEPTCERSNSQRQFYDPSLLIQFLSLNRL